MSPYLWSELGLLSPTYIFNTSFLYISLTLTATVYRPPDCPVASFRYILEQIQLFIDSKPEENQELYITGDFNLPNIDWKILTADSSLGKRGTESATLLLDFMSKNLLSQIINQPTRGNNTIDLA